MALGRVVVHYGRHIHVPPAWVYVLVWVGLIGLTLLSFALSFVNMGAGSVAVALGIAFVKSTLVVIFFMHFLEEHGISRLTLPMAVFLVALLGLFATFDVKTRFPPAIAGESNTPAPTWQPQRFSDPKSVPPTPLPRDLIYPREVGGPHIQGQPE